MTDTLPSRPARRPIDPRFRQRRIDVKREEGRRRLRWLMAGTGGLIAIVALALMAKSPLLAVRHVDIAGAVHTDPADVRRAGGLAGHPDMIDVNGGVAARAIERLPWVATATVHRAWPATVSVRLTERVPVATVGSGGMGGPWLVDAAGRVLGPSPSPSTLPPLLADAGVSVAPVGAAGSIIDPAYAPALQVARALPAGLVSRVTGIVVTADGSVDLHLGRSSAQLGLPSDALAEKLQAVETMLDKVNVGTAIIDVTVASAPVLVGG